MALSRLCDDEKRVIFDHLRVNSLEPRLAVNFCSTNKELRRFLTRKEQRKLKSDFKRARSLCTSVGVKNCKELREATQLNVAQATNQDLKVLANLSLLLPALRELNLEPDSGELDVQWSKALVAGSFPSITELNIDSDVGDAGASAIADALDRSALPRLKNLSLIDSNIGDAGLLALAPALRRRPLLEKLGLEYNEFSDLGLTALVALPPVGCTQLPLGVLPRLSYLNLRDTLITDAGVVTLADALQNGAFPALETLAINHFLLSSAVRANLKNCRPKLSWRTAKDGERANNNYALANVAISVAATVLLSTSIYKCLLLLGVRVAVIIFSWWHDKTNSLFIS